MELLMNELQQQRNNAKDAVFNTKKFMETFEEENDKLKDQMQKQQETINNLIKQNKIQLQTESDY